MTLGRTSTKWERVTSSRDSKAEPGDPKMSREKKSVTGKWSTCAERFSAIFGEIKFIQKEFFKNFFTVK